MLYLIKLSCHKHSHKQLACCMLDAMEHHLLPSPVTLPKLSDLCHNKSESKSNFYQHEIVKSETGSIQSDGRLIKIIQTGSQSKSRDEAKCLEFRLSSYEFASNIALSAQELAKAGFYYIGSDDAVQCFSCEKVVKDWSTHDDPFSKKWHSAGCEHINSIGAETMEISPTITSYPPTYGSESLLSSHTHQLSQRRPVSNLDNLSSAAQETVLKTVPKSTQTTQQTFPKHPTNESVLQSRDQQMHFQLSQHTSSSISPLSTSYELASRVENQSESLTMFPSLSSVTNPQHSSISTKPLKTSSQTVAHPTDISSFEPPIVENPSYTQSTTDIEIEENDPATLTTPEISPAIREETIPEEELDVGDDYLTDLERTLCRSQYLCQNPYSRDMVCLSRRMTSYNDLHLFNQQLNPSLLALAGFFYQGFGDNVQCWYCGVEASDWTEDKNPWVEHARLYPTCEYLLRNRGKAFVEAALMQESQSRRGSLRDTELNMVLEQSLERIQSGPLTLPTPPTESLFLSETQQWYLLNESMESQIVRSVLSMNFSREIVKRVIKRQIAQNSCNFQSIEALVEALLTEQMENPSSSNESRNQNTESRSSQESSSRNTSRTSRNQNIEVRSSQQASRETASLAAPNRRSSHSSAPQEAANETIERIQSKERCKVCLDKKASVLFRPCSHICACEGCARQLRSCPICRRLIQTSLLVTRP